MWDGLDIEVCIVQYSMSMDSLSQSPPPHKSLGTRLVHGCSTLQLGFMLRWHDEVTPEFHFSAWEVDGTNPFHEVNSQDALVTAVTAHLDQAY